jgi:cell division protein FtsI (penicillin-binding protein 3)
MRTPLRPLARILQARQDGLNPDSIERENLRLRHEVTREKSRSRAQFRLFVLCTSFVVASLRLAGGWA